MKILKYIFLSLTFIFSINNILKSFELENKTTNRLEITFYHPEGKIRLSLSVNEKMPLYYLLENNLVNYVIVSIAASDNNSQFLTINVEDKTVTIKEDNEGFIYI